MTTTQDQNSSPTKLSVIKTSLAFTQPVIPIFEEISSAVLSKEGFVAIMAFFVGCEASFSKESFLVAMFSFIGGSDYGHEVPLFTILYFFSGMLIGVSQATIYVVLLGCLVAYACEFSNRDVVFMGFAFMFGLLCSVSDQAFFLVAYSYMGGLVVRCDKEALLYMGLPFLIASSGVFSSLSMPFSVRF